MNGGSVLPEAAAAMSQREWILRQRTAEGDLWKSLREATDRGREPSSVAVMVGSEKATTSTRG